ncbi:hypothetical protein AAJ76_630009567 [Vairimorpha ceranae]|uniref:Uncharacterized protein n=1 Tax=Vairimorpha ceranae TaxID=40302 RepID=A0A0F9WND3_9MICR|nr:hypothetical protein AAJ76_630009567 [Vairimorpha ceranae]KAF5139595.1 hypothetical protein G9O61_00g022520 [Vairimorpha ceranae]KKO74523.1 hypothetical protein AAJ76_630009567 [Vairimorpha ceranae]
MADTEQQTGNNEETQIGGFGLKKIFLFIGLVVLVALVTVVSLMFFFSDEGNGTKPEALAKGDDEGDSQASLKSKKSSGSKSSSATDEESKGKKSSKFAEIIDHSLVN